MYVYIYIYIYFFYFPRVEQVNQQNDQLLLDQFMSVTHCLRCVSAFPISKAVSELMFVLYGSTYSCEQIFSVLNFGNKQL